jgi:hypothetical protein
VQVVEEYLRGRRAPGIGARRAHDLHGVAFVPGAEGHGRAGRVALRVFRPHLGRQADFGV